MIGKIIIDILFVFSLIGTITYFLSEKNNNEKLRRIGRYSYYTIFAGFLGVSIYFMILILTHDFQYTYIWSYTSKELPLHLLISSFYAGQEGSFMLWGLLTVVIGMFLIPYAKKHNYESYAMGLYTLIIAFILLILIVKSPFNLVWESFTDVAKGFTPDRGRGLNPILENFWITIHPPILFFGYASMAVPYVFAVAALMKKDYSNWVNISIPWTLLAAGFLGLGIGLGGFWSYETLGWGGFWAWDPVENASMLPWLVSMALVHTLLVQKSTGGLFKTNFFLSILSFILVLYATFLTRSGVLGDMSVHSFVDPGTIVYSLLLIFILAFLILGIVFIIIRIGKMEQNKLNFSLASKESMVTLGAISLIISTLIVFIGTSMPIFLELAGQPKTSVDISFYDKWNLPIAVFFMLICGFTYYLSWRSKKIYGLGKIIVPIVVAIGATIILYFAGLTKITHLLLVFSSIYCLYNSILFMLPIIRKSPKSIGSYLSHAGLGIFFIGVIYSGGYSESESIALATGETGQALGYNFTFIGSDRIEKEKPDREKYKCNIKIEKDDSFSFVSPIVYWSDFNQKQSPFFEPGILEKVNKDIYISPKSLSYENDIPSLVLSKDIVQSIPYDSTWSIKLIGFDMSHGMTNQSGEPFQIGSIVELSNLGETSIDTLFMEMDMANGGSAPIWFKLKETGISIGFSNVNINSSDMTQSEALVSFKKDGVDSKGAREIFVFEVSIKPLISFVWVGSLAIVIGFFIAILKHRKNNS